MNRRTLLLLAAVFCTTGCDKFGSKNYIESYEAVPIVGSNEAHWYKLANGLKLIVVENHTAPTLAYQTWFNVGSRHEQPKRTGLAHLFEHMMFKATKKYKDGEFMRTLESEGAQGLNAFTSRDYTAYVQQVPRDHLELVIKLESIRMTDLIVDEKAFNTEREVVQNERRMRTENNPSGKLYQSLFETAYKNHSYRWPVIGYAEDLANMKPKDALDFYRQFYGPSRALIVVVGDVEHEDVAKLISKYYGPLKANATETKLAQEPAQKKSRRKDLKLALQNDKLYYAYPIPEINHADQAALSLLPFIVTTGESSRMQKSLVETGLANYVSSGSLGLVEPGLFVFTAGAQRGKTTKQLEKAFKSEISKLRKTQPTPDELKRAINQYTFGFYSIFTTNAGIARFIGASVTSRGNFRYAIDEYEKIKTMPAKAIQEVAKKYFQDSKLTVITGRSK